MENSAVSFLNVGRLEGSIIQPAEQREKPSVHLFMDSETPVGVSDIFPSVTSLIRSLINRMDGILLIEKKNTCPYFQGLKQTDKFTAPKVEAKVLNIETISKSQKDLMSQWRPNPRKVQQEVKMC